MLFVLYKACYSFAATELVIIIMMWSALHVKLSRKYTQDKSGST